MAKITDDKVINCLSKIKCTEGSIAYLTLIKSVLKAYVDENTSDLDRIFHAVFVVYFLRIWRQYLKDKKIVKQHFITQPSFEGLEIDLVLLVRLIILHKVHELPDISTQHLEKYFRKVRSFSPMESMMATCSLKGFMTKSHRIQLEAILLNKFKETFGVKVNDVNLVNEREKISEYLLDCTLKKAIKQAKDEAAKLGMTCEKIELESFFSTNYAPVIEEEDESNVSEDFLDVANAPIDVSLMEDENHETDEVLSIENIQYPDIQSSNIYLFFYYFLKF